MNQLLKEINEFYESENKLSRALLFVLSYDFVYFISIASKKYLFADFIYNLSISFIAAFIFYIFQTYIPQRKIKNVAKKELARILARIVEKFSNIFFSTIKRSDLKKREELLNGCNNFMTKEVCYEIAENFSVLGPASVSPARDWADYLGETAQETKLNCENIVQKYSFFLSAEFIDFVHQLENDALIEMMRILPSHKESFLRANVLEDFFLLLENMNYKLNLEVSMSLYKGRFSIQPLELSRKKL